MKGSPSACNWYGYKSVTLQAVDDLSIKSCSKGTVLLVQINSNQIVRSGVVIQSDSISYFYMGLNTILVQKNQVINKGDIIGMIDEKNIDKRISFWVIVNNKEEYAEKYLIYDK